MDLWKQQKSKQSFGKIEKETDIGILQAVYTILLERGLDPKLKERLTIRALKSEEDVKANRVFNKEEMIRRITR